MSEARAPLRPPNADRRFSALRAERRAWFTHGEGAILIDTGGGGRPSRS